METAAMSINHIWKNVIGSIKTNRSIPDKVEKDFFTEYDLSIKLKIPRATLRTKLKAGVEQGKFELKKFRINSGNNIKPVNHFKIK